MNPKDRKYGFYIHDMLLSMERIQEYLGNFDFSTFKKNYMVVDAVIRNFEIIGEASKHIPNRIKSEYPQIPWQKMYALRSIITHEYFGVDYEIIWEIAKNELPLNYQDLKDLLGKEMLNGK